MLGKNKYQDKINKKEISNEQLEYMLRQAVMDGAIHCPYCDYFELEPDYDKCPSCHRENPLKVNGLI